MLWLVIKDARAHGLRVYRLDVLDIVLSNYTVRVRYNTVHCMYSTTSLYAVTQGLHKRTDFQRGTYS